jgi:hypothetical protein
LQGGGVKPVDPSTAPSSAPSSTESTDSSPSLPSPNPTRRPSLPPVTEQPTEDPTLDPTPVPTTTQPTSQPTAAGPITERFMNGLPPYSKELASNNTSSPQAKALDWLQKDPLYDEYQNVYRLNQRYALAVFYLSTNGEFWDNKTGWLSDNNECTWYMDGEGSDLCGVDSRLTILDLYGNNVVGSIPTEVELLSDLKRMSFGFYLNADGITGTIPTEM